jgi:hypothetical protein
MKPSQSEREDLARRIRQAHKHCAFSISQLASVAKVDPGQTSRILDGRFRTVSGNVVQICSVLGIDPHATNEEVPTPERAKTRAAWAKLEAAVRRAWDQSSGDAEVLVRVIDAVAKVRGR